MFSQPSVLVVEQDKKIREAMARRLFQIGFTVTEVCHPRQALCAATENYYDVAVVANDLPETDGLSLTEQLLRRGGVGRCVVVAQDAADINARAAARRGVFAVVPWERIPNDLGAVLERAFEDLCAGSLSDAEPFNQAVATYV